MFPITGVTVCVGYDDLLALTLPRNMRHLDSCTVVTSWEDVATQRLCNTFPDIHCFVTDGFTAHGAKFNKGLALEQMWNHCGREGWIAVIDADTLLPSWLPVLTSQSLLRTKLYSARRRMVETPAHWCGALLETADWSKYPYTTDRFPLMPGFFHLFHASDPHLKNLPWYDVTFAHAGGGDGYFQSRWPKEDKVMLPFDVLHLGPRDANWWGRASPRVDGQTVPQAELNFAQMREYLQAKGWLRGVSSGRNPHYPERVQVPGYAPLQWVHAPGS